MSFAFKYLLCLLLLYLYKYNMCTLKMMVKNHTFMEWTQKEILKTLSYLVHVTTLYQDAPVLSHNYKDLLSLAAVPAHEIILKNSRRK